MLHARLNLVTLRVLLWVAAQMATSPQMLVWKHLMVWVQSVAVLMVILNMSLHPQCPFVQR